MDIISGTVCSGPGLGWLLLFLLVGCVRSALISPGLFTLGSAATAGLAMRVHSSQVLGGRLRLSCDLCGPLLWCLPEREACSVLWPISSYPAQDEAKVALHMAAVPSTSRFLTPEKWGKLCVLKGKKKPKRKQVIPLKKAVAYRSYMDLGASRITSRVVSLGYYLTSLGFSFFICSKRKTTPTCLGGPIAWTNEFEELIELFELMDKEISIAIIHFEYSSTVAFYYCFFPFADPRHMQGFYSEPLLHCVQLKNFL